MNYFIIKMQNKKPNLKRISPREVKKNDKIFCVRRNQVYYIGEILK